MLPTTDVVLISNTINEIPWYMEDTDYFYIEVIQCEDCFHEWEEVRVHQLMVD